MDAGREPLDAGALRAQLPDGWRLEVIDEIGSTHATLSTALADGRALPGDVLAAEHQIQGRGRLGRAWVSPPRAGLTVSLAVAPVGVPAPRWTWLPLLHGLAVARAIGRATDEVVRPLLKWPNDLLVADRKLGGVLVARVGDAAVLSCGVNVATSAGELPEGATSLALAGAAGPDRGALLLALLAELDALLASWSAAEGDPEASGLARAYAARCTTLGQRVRVDLPGGAAREGLATGLDDAGRLLVDGVPVSAGDVVHVRRLG